MLRLILIGKKHENLQYCLNKGAQYYLQTGHKSILNEHKFNFMYMINTDGKRKEMQT